MRLAVVLAKLCATESPTIFATGRKDSGNRLIGIPYRLAMIGQWARLFTQLTTFRTMDLLWRIEWIGRVGYNTSVPSDPLMDVCMAQLPAGETNPLSARSPAQTKRTVRIGGGLLPYISTASVWRRRRPVLMNLAASRHWLCFDTSSCRILPLADLANAIPRSSYLFGVSWPDVRRTLLVAVVWPGFTRGDACEAALSNLPGNNGVEPRAVNDNKASLPPTNRSSWGQGD